MLARAAALLAARRSAPAALQQLARNFADAPAPKKAAAAPKQTSDNFKLPDAPLSLSGIPGSLATLVWQIAAKENQLEKVQDELQQMVEAFKQLPELREVAVDPLMATSVKVSIIKAVLQGSQATEITKRLFEALAEENALSATLQLAEHYDELMLAHRKEVYCTIVTAQPLDKLEKVELRKQATSFVEPGFKLVMKEKVDSKLLGGFILEFEDRLVDMSVSKKLEEFNNLVFKLENDLRV
jgi:F-type H+-transporting ATPase subunit O